MQSTGQLLMSRLSVWTDALRLGKIQGQLSVIIQQMFGAARQVILCLGDQPAPAQLSTRSDTVFRQGQTHLAI